MGVKQWVRAVLVLSALPSSALALGLGDIRLNSPLNAPLDAEIDLVNATAEELASLRVQLASRETFARYGLEWPAFLSSVTLAKAKGDAGRDVLRVRSTEAITEPFLTLLVDANWGRGRLVREYTLLLDPPVFAPTPAPSAAVQAPATAAARSGAVARPAATADPRPALASAATAPPTAAGDDGTYSVRRGETLSGIASAIAAGRGASTEQAMVGLYRANPSAFDGTMNVLRAGAVLRVPDAATLTSIDRSAALSEVRRQRSEWRSRAVAANGAAGETGSSEGRLRLVPPSESGTGAGAEGSARDTQAMRDRVAQLEKELSESRRLLEVRSAQIADLQQKLSAGSGAAATAPAATPAPAESAPPAVADATTEPSAAPAGAAAAAAAAAASPETAAAKPVTPLKRPRNRPAADTTPAVEEPSLVGSLLDSVLQFWWVLVGLAALAAGFFGYRRWQQNRAAEIEDNFGGATTTAREMSMPAPAGSDTARLRRPNFAGPVERSGFVVEESGEYEQPRLASSGGAPATNTVSADDTLSGETGINLDQGDPLAEADFHMAYGLYDQAADLVRLAASREPERRDLKLKLAEVFFVWGNRDEFLKSARELHRSVGESAAGEWEKIVIMGKQIAPEDPLFAGASARGAVSGAGLDLQLDGGSQPLDFDVFGDGTGSTQSLESVAGSDLEFGPARRDEPTIERLGPGGGGGGGGSGPDAPTVLVEVGGDTTPEMAPQFRDAPMAESPHLDVNLEDFLGTSAGSADSAEAPTVEQPALRVGGSPTIRAKLDAALRQNATAGDQTAELAIDDLGLDLGDLEQLEGLDAPGASEIEPDERGSDRASADAPTMLASFDADARRLIEEAANRSTGRGNGHGIDLGATAAMETLRVDVSSLNGQHDPGATSMVAALDTTQFDAGEYDLSNESGLRKSIGTGLDLDIGQSTLPDTADTGRNGTRNGDLTLPSLEPLTISEVGTKLDLARAYMDMGDPDGARNILREVLSEGSVSQKQEANRLLESLPG
jgi:pilus assembly protein FimV